MNKSPLPTNQAAAQLLLDLFDGQPNELLTPFEQWVTASRPFTLFGQKYLSKIRKKVRMSRDVEETYNLYCELRTAYLLLQEPKFAVAYELHGMEPGRSADFTVTFRTNMTFQVEVTRLRTSQHEQQLFQRESANGEAGLEQQSDLIRRTESRRLADVICDKFGQLSPETPNILWVWGESRVMRELEVGQVMLDLRRRAEQRDADFFARYRLSKPADFIRYYQRLSAIVLQSLHEPGPDRPPILWQNKDSKRPLPSKVANLLRALIAADNSPDFTANGVEDRSSQ